MCCQQKKQQQKQKLETEIGWKMERIKERTGIESDSQDGDGYMSLRPCCNRWRMVGALPVVKKLNKPQFPSLDQQTSLPPPPHDSTTGVWYADNAHYGSDG